MLKSTSRILALLTTGLLAGILGYGWLNLAPVFHEVPADVHLAFRVKLMNHNSVMMPALMFIAFTACATYAYTSRRIPLVRNMAVISAVLAIAVFLVTRFGNVPINQQIRGWSPQTLPANWQEILNSWDLYHAIRTCCGLLCFIILNIANHFDCGVMKY